MSEDLESHFKEVQSLNLTARVRHILDGESDIVPDDDDILSPINHINITNKDTQEEVGEEQQYCWWNTWFREWWPQWK